jgi:hypothetical protein
MSAFMSFATGAIREIGNQIDRYQTQTREDELAEASAERDEAKVRLSNQLEGDLRVKLKKMDQEFQSKEFDRKIEAEERLIGRKLSNEEKLIRLRQGFEIDKIRMQQKFGADQSKLERELRRDLSADQIAAKINISDADRKSLEKRAANQIASQEQQLNRKLSQAEKDAIRNNTYKYAALDQAADLQAKQMASEEKIANLKIRVDRAKNFNRVGDYLEWRRDSSPDEQVTNFFQSIEENGAGFESALNDADTKQKMIAALRRNFGQITAGVGKFSTKRNLLGGATQTTTVAPPHLVAQLSMMGVKNRKVLEFARQFMRSPTQNLGVNPGPNAAAMQQRGGNFAVFRERPGLDAAVARFRKTQYGTGLDERSDIVAKIHDRLGNMTEESYDKYINAFNSPLGNLVSAEGTFDTAQKQAAQDYLYNRANGFIDENGKLKINDLKKFVEVFGRANAQADSPLGSIAPQVKFAKIKKGNIEKDINNTRDKAESGRGALISIDNLIELVSRSGSSGRIIDNVRLLKLGLPQLLRDGGAIVAELMRGFDGKLAGNNFIDENGDVLARYSEAALQEFTTARAQAERAMDSGSEADKATALINMYETVLAYQITGILQGGTGGRTISDEDIRNAKKLMSSSTGTLETRLEKLKALKGLVTTAINKQELYSILTDDKNADIYQSVKRAFSLVKSEYTLKNFFSTITERAGGTEAALTSNNAQAIVQTIQDRGFMGGAFNREDAFDSVREIIKDGGRAQIRTSTPEGSDIGPYVFNRDAMERFANGFKDFKEMRLGARAYSNLVKEIQEKHPVVYELQTNSFRPIIYSRETGKISIGEGSPQPADTSEVGDQSSLDVDQSTFALATSKLFNAA